MLLKFLTLSLTVCVLARKVNCNQIDLVLDLKRTYQKIQGFGGAVTDAAGINWKSLNTALRKLLTNNAGLEYNMARVPIGGCDFSTHPYAYNELPVNDKYLSNFTLSPEDYKYRLPLLSEITKTSKVPVNIVATTWSPPPWMKTNNAYTGVDLLKSLVQKDFQYGGKWIVGNLGPTIKKSKFKNIVKKYPKALKYIDGIAVHYYSDGKFAPHILDEVAKTHPEKFILCTEASEVFADKQEFYKEPMYYALAHFTKFIPRNSIRIKVKSSTKSVENTARFHR
ncbi:unnamed protein product [Leptidea sinapis]|uniref:Glucosylceramidase n=1 Tax=Leptidea sinapis TaxID=189913 RepID=A0A5E4PWR6_9NEOP|nr:unnamed protein product [Leptidea sinapis]